MSVVNTLREEGYGGTLLGTGGDTEVTRLPYRFRKEHRDSPYKQSGGEQEQVGAQWCL